jgi:hypothetical protein
MEDAIKLLTTLFPGLSKLDQSIAIISLYQLERLSKDTGYTL